MESAL